MLLVSGIINNDKIQFIHINMYVISNNHSREFKTEFWVVKDLNHLKKNTTALMILYLMMIFLYSAFDGITQPHRQCPYISNCVVNYYDICLELGFQLIKHLSKNKNYLIVLNHILLYYKAQTTN